MAPLVVLLAWAWVLELEEFPRELVEIDRLIKSALLS
jgi:hypothetical protein